MAIKKYLLLIFSIVLFAVPAGAQLNPHDVTIARDEWGVPHIFAPTDAGVAYGLAWATCEDDFKTLQEQMLAVRGKLAEVQGKSGAILDFGIKFMGLLEFARERYRKDLSPPFLDVLAGYGAGANAYARAHPQEVLLKSLFPLQPEDLVAGYMLGLVNLSGAQRDISRILNGRITEDEKNNFPRGSNAIAISSKKTTDGKTYLAINSHQPLEGWYSWYEAHLVSEEGLNILGGTFPGGVTIFHGANEHLGWAHTVNHADFSDVFKLVMHPTRKHYYRFDGRWEKLDRTKYKAKVKAGVLKIPVTQKVYRSKYGVTFKTDNGYYAWRFVANRDVRAAEQWYRMNKATSFEEFREALAMLGIPCTNIVYADKKDNIYYISNGRLPQRNYGYHWQEVLPGDTSATLWPDHYFPLDSLPQIQNPRAGYVFNTNQTPFRATAKEEDIPPSHINPTMGYQGVEEENNRSRRFAELIGQYDKLSYEDFKKIKYDVQFPRKITGNMAYMEAILHLDPQKYPDLAAPISILNNWDRAMSLESTGATLFGLSYDYLRKREDKTETQMIEALRYVLQYLKEHFGKELVPWGEVNRLIRGQVDLPMDGGPDVLGAIYSQPFPGNHGRYRAIAGDSYIELIRFSEQGVEIESVNTYGSSARPESLHYTDQMALFSKRKLKVMTLDKKKVMEGAVKIYHPE